MNPLLPNGRGVEPNVKRKNLQKKPPTSANARQIPGASKSGWVASLERAAGRKPTTTSRSKIHPPITQAGRPKEIRAKLSLPTFRPPVQAMRVYPTISATITILTSGRLLPLPLSSPHHHPSTPRLFPVGWISHSNPHTDPNHPNPTPASLPRRLPRCTKDPTRVSGISQ